MKDFLSRRPVRASILFSSSPNEGAIKDRLPEDYLYENGLFRFPAGFWESYFVNGKEYNVDGNRSLEEQKELIIQDLMEENGFQREEAEEFINEIETKEGRPMLLNKEASDKWLKYHPEFEHEALQKLNEARTEAQSEGHLELNKRHGRK